MKPAKIITKFLIFTLLFSSRALGANEGDALLAAGKYREAAKIFERMAAASASDGNSRLKLALCRLRSGDAVGADAVIMEAVNSDSSLAPQGARLWMEEGRRSLKAGSLDRGAGMFKKAVQLDRGLAKILGTELIKSADALEDERARGRLVILAAAWVGAEEAAARSADYFSKRLGPPRQARLDAPGWTQLANLMRPGDVIYYLATEQFLQRDGGAMRIMPQAVELPVKMVLELKDMGGKETTGVWVAQREKPARTWFWVLPGDRN